MPPPPAGRQAVPIAPGHPDNVATTTFLQMESPSAPPAEAANAPVLLFCRSPGGRVSPPPWQPSGVRVRPRRRGSLGDGRRGWRSLEWVGSETQLVHYHVTSDFFRNLADGRQKIARVAHPHLRPRLSQRGPLRSSKPKCERLGLAKKCPGGARRGSGPS